MLYGQFDIGLRERERESMIYIYGKLRVGLEILYFPGRKAEILNN